MQERFSIKSRVYMSMYTINNVMYMSFSMIVISDDRCVHTCTQCSNVSIHVHNVVMCT